jgi:ABC-type cobalamin/Fe3+-siderophores transport system ATPase subunit
MVTRSRPKPLINAVEVDDLFGRYSYRIHRPKNKGRDSRLLLLHGDNGSGKTTILRMLWNLLSPANDRGHRSFLAKTPFRRFLVALSDGVVIEVTRASEKLVGTYSVRLKREGKIDLLVTFTANANLRVPSSNPAQRAWAQAFSEADLEQLLAGKTDVTQSILGDVSLNDLAEMEFLEFLSEMKINPLFLADDRILYSDDEAIGKTREIIVKKPSDHEGAGRTDAEEVVGRELRLTIRRVNEWIRELTLGGQSDGSANANQIYANVLRQLAKKQSPDTSSLQSDVEAADSEVTSQLELLAVLAPKYEEFGLVPKFDAEQFSRLYASIPAKYERTLAAEIISPFLSTIAGRYEALAAAEFTLRALLPRLNSFFRDKAMIFTPREGLRIVTDDHQPLPVTSLSSGERQLAMLLCTTLLASRDTRMFIVDEPELSLGVEWQRNILDALLDVTEGSSLQFLVATHSIEVISGHPASLVRLIDRTTDDS